MSTCFHRDPHFLQLSWTYVAVLSGLPAISCLPFSSFLHHYTVVASLWKVIEAPSPVYVGDRFSSVPLPVSRIDLVIQACVKSIRTNEWDSSSLQPYANGSMFFLSFCLKGIQYYAERKNNIWRNTNKIHLSICMATRFIWIQENILFLTVGWSKILSLISCLLIISQVSLLPLRKPNKISYSFRLHPDSTWK